MNKLIIVFATTFFTALAFNEFEFVENFCEEDDLRITCCDFSFSEDDLKEFTDRVFTISKATEVKLNGEIKFLNEYLFEKFPEAEIFKISNNESISYELRKPFERPDFEFESKIKTLVLGNSEVDGLEDSTSFHCLKDLENIKITFSKAKNIHKTLKIDDSLLEKNTKLRNITIETSNIAEITEGAFRNLKELETLILKNNKLSFFEPKTFQFQTKLTILNIADNDIQYLTPGSFWPASLVALNLTGNKVETITKNHFKNLSNLKYLDMSYNAIKLISPNSFASNKKLKIIDLKNNRIQKIRAFRNLEELVDLDVSNNAVDNIQGDLFGNCRSLKNLNLRNNSILILFTTFNPELVKLDLSLNKINYLQGFDFNGLRSLEFLNLSNNILKTRSFAVPGIKDGSFRDLVELKHLSLENNLLEKDDIFRNLVRNMQKLEKFHLNGNGEFNFEDDVFDDLDNLEYLSYH